MKRTAEQIEEICKTFKSGVSAGVIGARLGVSRNVVIGIVYRHGHKLGLSRSGRAPTKRIANYTPKSWRAPPKRKTEARINRRDIVAGLPTSPLPDAATTDVPKMRFAHRDMQRNCAWIIGEPTADAMCCGEKSVPGLPYCEHHARRAYDTPQPAQRSPGRANHVRTAGRPREVAI